MRRIEKRFLTGCAYTVIILALFYLFAAITEFTAPAITTGQFFLILLFGILISAAELIYELLKIRRALKCLIHYGVLLVAFCVIFIASGNIASGKGSAIFVAIIIYTFLYFAIWLLFALIKKTLQIADDKLDHTSKPGKNNDQKTYKPLYKDED